MPGFGWVRMREELRFAGAIVAGSLHREADRWFASCQVDTGIAPQSLRAGPAVGIDVGIKTLATLFEGTVYANPRALQTALAKLWRVDKAIARSRKVHGARESQHRNRLCQIRRRLHARVKHIRQDCHHKATSAIAKTCAVVKVEALHISGMVRNRRLARALSDAGLGDFLRMLEYKCQWYGARFEKVDRRYLSSRTCSRWGAHQAALRLSERTYRCSRCAWPHHTRSGPTDPHATTDSHPGNTLVNPPGGRTAAEVCNSTAFPCLLEERLVHGSQNQGWAGQIGRADTTLHCLCVTST